MTKIISIKSSDRYSTLRQIEGWNQKVIRGANVLVVGAGALGNEVMKNLALLGVGHIVVVDFDVVEASNLSRSILFRPDDNGRSKSVLAAQMIKEINEDISVNAISGDIRWDVGLGIIRRMDVVIGGLDNRAARVALNQHCWATNVPWVDGALSEAAGLVRVFTPPDGACYECGLSAIDYEEMNFRYSCQGIAFSNIISGKIPTTPITASITGAMQVQEAIKILHHQPILAGHELIYDVNSRTYQIVSLQRRSDCPAHFQFGEVVEFPEFSVENTTAGELLSRVQTDLGKDAWVDLDREMIIGISCPHGREKVFLPSHKAQSEQIYCQVCANERVLDLTHKIENNSPYLDNQLIQWGVPPGHILQARNNQRSIYYELTGDIPRILPWLQK